MDVFDKLTEQFKRFPGIGGRQAKRFVYFLLQSDPADLTELSRLIAAVKDSMSQCRMCYRYFEKSSAEPERAICRICANKNIETNTLLVVEKEVDIETMERSNAYHGRYFVLGGIVPILEKDPTLMIRSRELFTEVTRRAQEDGLQEIILALSVNPEGDNTTVYLEKALAPVAEKFKLKISILGRGLSTGSELEYSDPETLRNALQGRK